MSFATIDPKQAHEHLTSDDGYAYVDVRTVAEFEGGHPDGAVNIPILVAGPLGRMAPNRDFLRVMKAVYSAETPLLMGCMMGGRSAQACQLLAANGYTRLHNVAGGFSGARSARGHQPGWQELGLPVSRTGRTWEELKGTGE